MDKPVPKDLGYYKIAIVGPESTGKSSLSLELAHHFNGIAVPEFAREYCAMLDRPYTLEDIVAISQGQVQAEVLAETGCNAPFIFYDTTVLVEKVWADHAYGHVPSTISELLKQRAYHLYLLTDIDVPWQPDPQREHPHLREHFKHVYQQELKQMQAEWHWVSGVGKARTLNAIAIINQWLSKQK